MFVGIDQLSRHGAAPLWRALPTAVGTPLRDPGDLDPATSRSVELSRETGSGGCGTGANWEDVEGATTGVDLARETGGHGATSSRQLNLQQIGVGR